MRRARRPHAAMNQKAEGTTARIEVTREGGEWSVRENGRTVIRFFGGYPNGGPDIGHTAINAPPRRALHRDRAVREREM